MECIIGFAGAMTGGATDLSYLGILLATVAGGITCGGLSRTGSKTEGKIDGITDSLDTTAAVALVITGTLDAEHEGGIDNGGMTGGCCGSCDCTIIDC